MTERRSFYITTAISYANGPPHIGHAYEAIATDVIARFKRLDGYETMFLTGTDEHGQKVVQTAQREGKSPKEFVEQLTPLFQEMVERLNCSNDDFIRTTEARHASAAQELWRRMANNGDIYKDSYAGWYSVRDEAYYAEDELTKGLDGELISPNGTPVEWMEEESYFFKLSKYEAPLLKYYKDHPEFIQPDSRRNEITSFVRSGLRDLSISRTSFDWGVPVPDDPKHVMYVWVDALTNYLTGAGFPDEKSEKFQKFWPADAHVIGKDILRFHTVYWPAFLMSAGVELPKKIFGHGFLLSKGEKMSKSVGNVVDPFELADAYGVDQLRYFCMREVVFGQDGNYSHEAMINRINADLANDLGNLAQRSLSMIAKNCDGKVPTYGEFLQDDGELLASAYSLPGAARTHMDNLAIHAMLGDVWEVVAIANRYFAGQEPWALRKSDPERMGTVLYVTAEVLRQLAILAQPVVPEGAAKLLDQLGVSADARSFAFLGSEHRLEPGSALPAPEGVFPRIIDEPVE